MNSLSSQAGILKKINYMSTTNGMPVVFNDEQDQGLLGSLFPNSLQDATLQDYLTNSPFGNNSLFNSNAIRISRNLVLFPESSTKWLYIIKQSQSGTELIKEYKKYDSVLAESAGNTDDITDFIIYIEDNFTVNFGRVLLIKMSNKMLIHYFDSLKNNPETNIISIWSKLIFDKEKNNSSFSATAQDIEDAFYTEIQYRVAKNNGEIKFTSSEIVKIISNELSKKIRAFKIPPEYWDPTLKSENYSFEIFEKAIAILISNLNNCKKELASFRKKINIIKQLLNNPLHGTSPYIDKTIAFIQTLENNINQIIAFLKTTKDKGKIYFAFICGVINGMIEFVCGIFDVIFLILDLIYSNAVKEKAEVKLEYLELKEGLEEFLEHYHQDPDFLGKKITEMINAYEYARYKDKQLDVYQIAHNSGEDLVLLIDIVLSFIAIIKALTNSSKYLPKFTEWIDEVVERNPRIANKLENAVLKIIKSIYGESELSKLAIKFRKTLPVPRHGGNIAVFEYLDEGGRIVRKEFTTQITSDAHSEAIGIEWLRDNNIPDERVTKIYSELEPCSLKRHNCKQKLQRFKNAEIEFSYDYPGDNTSGVGVRQASIAEREKDLKKLVN